MSGGSRKVKDWTFSPYGYCGQELAAHYCWNAMSRTTPPNHHRLVPDSAIDKHATTSNSNSSSRSRSGKQQALAIPASRRPTHSVWKKLNVFLAFLLLLLPGVTPFTPGDPLPPAPLLLLPATDGAAPPLGLATPSRAAAAAAAPLLRTPPAIPTR